MLLIATVPDASPAVPNRPEIVYVVWMSVTVVEELLSGPEYVYENERSAWIAVPPPRNETVHVQRDPSVQSTIAWVRSSTIERASALVDRQMPGPCCVKPQYLPACAVGGGGAGGRRRRGWGRGRRRRLRHGGAAHDLAVPRHALADLCVRDVTAGAAVEAIDAGAAREDVVAPEAEQPVVPPAARDPIGGRRSAQHVVARGADDVRGERRRRRQHQQSSERDRRPPQPTRHLWPTVIRAARRCTSLTRSISCERPATPPRSRSRAARGTPRHGGGLRRRPSRGTPAPPARG